MNRLLTLLFHDVYAQQAAESGFRGAAADRYKLPLERFRRQLEAIAQTRADPPVPVTAVPARGVAPPWAISFDDGGISYHSLIAPLLAERGWTGHCFVTTDRIGQAGFLHAHHIRELRAAGHVVGTHSASHPPRIDSFAEDRLVAEWAESKAVLEDILGEAVTVGSVPGGYYAPRVAQAARAAGLELLLTSEPESTPREVDGCLVLGRYTLRRDSADDLAGRLLASGPARLRQWAAWNAKKALKKTLGTGYIHLSSRLAR